MPKIKTVYLDMDGVLFDFVAGYNNMYGNFQEGDDIGDDFKEGFAKDNFFRFLPLFKDAKKLVKYVEGFDVNIEILTSVGKFNSKDVSVDKVMALKNHFPKYSSKFNYVKSSKDKAQWAAPDTLLIDDRKKSTEPFERAGGNVVLYKSFSSAKNIIKKFLEDK